MPVAYPIGGIHMKRWAVFILFFFLLGQSSESLAITDHFDRGQGTFLDIPLMKIPMGAGSESKGSSEKQGEGAEAKSVQEKQKENMDKKVDDAIKKAWEEK